MASLPTVINRLNYAYLVYGIFYLINSIALTAGYLDREADFKTFAVLLLYPITAMIFIGFTMGRSALRTADKMEFNNFACLVLSGLILQKIVDSLLLKKRPFDLSAYSSDVFVVMLDISLMVLIFGFQLILSVCAFVYATRLSFRPVDPEASKAQNLETLQQSSETLKSHQSSETPKSQKSSETLKSEEKSERQES